MKQRRRLLAVGHQYVIGPYRRLPLEIAKIAHDWDVTIAPPVFWHGHPRFGDFRAVTLEPTPEEESLLRPVRMHFTQRIHVAMYGMDMHRVLASNWDVVHCWQEPFVFAGGQVALWKRSETKLVFSSFQNIAKKYPPPFSLIERFALQRSAAWVANGESVMQTLEAKSFYRSRPHERIWPGVDTTAFRPDAARRSKVISNLGWADDGAPIVGFLGRFVPSKGVQLLMNALDHVATPWRAVFVGGGEMEASMREWSTRYGDRVRIVTGVSHEAVPAQLNAFDLICAPSQTTPKWREQFGRMLVEAFASGVPVIASDSGEIPYVIGEAGLVVGEHDLAGWVSAIERLLADPNLREDLGQRGLERANATFAWPKVASRYVDFFESIIG